MVQCERFIRALVISFGFLALCWTTALAQTVADFRHDTDYEFMSRSPKFHLLLTANSTYDNFPDLGLPGVLKDAESIRELFTTTLEYDELNDPQDQTVVSYNDFFTRQLPAAIDQIEEGDVFVFYFSGHGFSFRNQNYIVPKDFPSDAETMLGNAIKVTDIINEVARRKRPSAIILIIDACRTDIALPASIDRSFDDAAFKLAPAGQGSPLEKLMPDPRQYSVVWFPTGPLSAAMARDDAESPFTAALVKAVTEKSKDWKIEHSVPVLAEAIQTEYDKLVGETGTTTVDHIASSNRSTAIPNLKVSEELQDQSEGEWAKSIYNARRQMCLAPIRDFLFNFPWSRSRIAAEVGLNKWFGTFKTAECVQKSQLALSACAITEGVVDGSFASAARIVVSPKRLPVSPAGITDCSTAVDSDLSEGFVATGRTLSEARKKLAANQRRISLEKKRTWDSLVLTRSTGKVVGDVILQAYKDEALTKPVAIEAQTPNTSSNPTNSGNSFPFVVNGSREIDSSALEKLYLTGTPYKQDDVARVQVAGKTEELFVHLLGNSTTEPVDIGTLLASESVHTGQDDASDIALDSLKKTMTNLLAKKHTIFFVSVEFESTSASDEFPSRSYNSVMNTLFSRFKLDASRIISSRRATTKVGENGFRVSIFGI